MLSPILTLFARISKPLWLNIRSTGAEVASGKFHALWVTKTESSWSQVPRPRPRPRLEGSKTKTKTETETRGFQDQDQDQDSEVPRPRPRPRLVKTGLKTSRDQDSSLENSKSGRTGSVDELKMADELKRLANSRWLTNLNWRRWLMLMMTDEQRPNSATKMTQYSDKLNEFFLFTTRSNLKTGNTQRTKHSR